METAGFLGDVSDHLIGHFVDQARRAGASWTEIGQHMGVSKQAAQQRFVPRVTEDLDFPAGGRLSRFTPRSRAVVENCRSWASERGDKEIGCEHLLIALIDQSEGLAAQAILALAAPLETVRAAAESLLSPPSRRSGKPRFGRGAKKTLELSLREALHLGHNYIGTEHLLLGILRNDSERAAVLLQGFGMSVAETEEWLTTLLESIQTGRVSLTQAATNAGHADGTADSESVD
jgi:ATP-dependent Clp protease ATP-binding subunit ClpA